MLRLKMLCGPPATFLKLYSQEVAGIAERTVLYGADQFTIPIPHNHPGSIWNAAFHLQANSAKGNIFEISDTPPLVSRFVSIGKLHKLRAKQP
jgi:hypothetical protein